MGHQVLGKKIYFCGVFYKLKQKFNIKNIKGESKLSEANISTQKYRDKLRYYCKKKINEQSSYENEWWDRSEIAAKRILTAISYRETSNKNYQLNKSVALPSIGYYYSIFHLSVALLALDYSTDLLDLHQIKHKDLVSLIYSKFIQRKILPMNYYNIFLELKELREYVNYVFGRAYFNKSQLDILYNLTGEAFDSAIKLINEINDVISDLTPILYNIQTNIGDRFGDDILQNFLSEKDIRSVEDYLLKHDLTT